MAARFQEQGGAATMDPGGLQRWVTSRLMTHLSRPERMARKRRRAERARRRGDRPHVVEYFHQVEDGYSHLAAQILKSLAQRYEIELVCHLVPAEKGRNAPEPELLQALSRYDARHVAPEYGLSFSSHDDAPPQSRVALAGRILAAVDNAAFIDAAAEVGEALWSGDDSYLDTLASRFGTATEQELAPRLDAGAARRKELGHYSGAMFYYEGEWYWGVDRLYHLETRLAELGVDRDPGAPLLVARPPEERGPLRDDGSLTLEVFPSLRSPYTAISFDRAVALAKETGVQLVVRPVLPMVMRGVPATRVKGMYIFWDAAREARAAGVPYGNFYDPIGEPVRRAYSLYPWAVAQGRGNALISAFLACAFARGINTNARRGLRRVVELAGLDWHEASEIIGDSEWEDLLEENRLAMYASGLWGVPSFRLLNRAGEEILALWGQDRLWLFAREIQRQLGAQA